MNLHSLKIFKTQNLNSMIKNPVFPFFIFSCKQSSVFKTFKLFPDSSNNTKIEIKQILKRKLLKY